MSARLRLNIDDTQTTIDILDTSNFPVNGGVIQIEDEKISYESATSQGVVGCTRGFDGTSADSHLAGLEVTLLTEPMSQVGPIELSADGSPTDNLTGVKIAPTGSRYEDSSTGDMYINTGDSDEPVWSLLSTSDVGAVWGNITGDLDDQTDLQSALDAKQDDLGFTPENVTNKKTDLSDNSDTFYPTQKAVKTVTDGKQDSLGFTPANKAGDTFTGTVTFDKAVVMPTVAYTASDATPVTPDARNVEVYLVTVDANLTVNGPSNPYSGQKILLQLRNDASHSVTFATGSGNFRFGTDITSYTATASKTDYVGVVYNSTDTRWDIVSIIQGF